MLSPIELGVIVALVLLLAGAKRIPKMGRQLGRATKEARAGLQESTPDDKQRSE
jgi:TatA/E family protein of Tat protein translocase